jgi:hypothetical protein
MSGKSHVERVMNTILTTISMLFLVATTSLATEWVIVPGAQVDGDIICLDRDNVYKEKGIISAWIKRFKEGGSYTKTLFAFDCSRGQTRTVKSVDFDKATTITTRVEYESSWEISPLETPASAASMMICKKGRGFNPALVSMKEKL